MGKAKATKSKPTITSHEQLAKEDAIVHYDAPAMLHPFLNINGKCPSGSMSCRFIAHKECPGYQKKGVISIKYDIPSGTQTQYHPNPGVFYPGTKRIAYVPHTMEGCMLLSRLKVAFSRGHMFNVGRSLTSQKDDQVTWGSIPNKTSLHGGPFGFPDNSYIEQANKELDAKAIPDADQCLPIVQAFASNGGKRSAFVAECIFYKAPEKFIFRNSIASILVPSAPTSQTNYDANSVESLCSICLGELSLEKSVEIANCSHAFHESCILDALNYTDKCPMCRKCVSDKPQGKSPSGTMETKLIPDRCPGYAGCNTVQITYIIPRGIQQDYHENPRTPYEGTTRIAYLPNSCEGRQLLLRLKYAFANGLSFRIGTSLTTGRQNEVTWTSIHHKTCLSGGAHGFPDPNYIDNCNASLDALHVPPADGFTA